MRFAFTFQVDIRCCCAFSEENQKPLTEINKLITFRLGLSVWVKNQRVAIRCEKLGNARPKARSTASSRKKMTPTQMRRLESLGFEWAGLAQTAWDQKFELLCQYKKVRCVTCLGWLVREVILQHQVNALRQSSPAHTALRTGVRNNACSTAA